MKPVVNIAATVRSEPCGTLPAMARLGKALAVLFVIGIFALLIWAFVRGVKSDPAVVGTISTALLGFAGLVYQRSRERSQELERSHRAEMAPSTSSWSKQPKT